MIRSALLAVLFLTGCTGTLYKPRTLDAEPVAAMQLQRYQTQYVLGPGDLIEVVVDRLPELSRTVTIRGDGGISYPKVGEVRLEGLTLAEAQDVIETRLKERVLSPEVTIIVQNPPPPMVYVAGEVGLNKPVPLRDAPTMATALIQSGGLGPRASHANVVLIRLDEDGRLNAIPVGPQGPGRAGTMLALQNISLQPNDLILVQESSRSKFTRFIQDFVNTPLGSFNQLLAPYVQLELLREINES